MSSGPQRAPAGHDGDAARQLDDLVELWHSSDDDRPLHEYLGVTWDEYASWARTGPTGARLDQIRAHVDRHSR